MTQIIINSEQTLSNAIGQMREWFREKKYFTVNAKFGKKRSLDQNAMSHAWYLQVANELRENTAVEVKRYCKLHFGVPILRAENDDFRTSYDAVIRPLDYEKKLLAMDILPVTSLMTTLQLSQYCEAVQMHYIDKGVQLEFPE